MAEVGFITPVPAAIGHPKVVLIPEQGAAVTLPIAPREVEQSSMSGRWVEVERPGRDPVLLYGGGQLRKQQLEIVVGYPQQTSIETLLARLRAMASGQGRVRLSGYGPSEAGWWRITDATQRSELRQHGTNQITRATVTLSLTEAIGLAVAMPVAKAKPVAFPRRPLTAAERRKIRNNDTFQSNDLLDPNRYKPGFIQLEDGSWTRNPRQRPGSTTVTRRWQKGDSLQKLAQAFYGSSAQWRTIATANGIRDPRKIKVGQLLKIPYGASFPTVPYYGTVAGIGYVG